MQSVHLNGAEEVQRAGHMISSSAEGMQRAGQEINGAADTIQHAVRSIAHENQFQREFLSGWLDRLEGLLKPAPSEPQNPAEIARQFAVQMGEDLGLAVDHDAFDRWSAHLAEDGRAER